MPKVYRTCRPSNWTARARLAQLRPAPTEDQPQQFRQREDVLAMRYGCEYVVLDPLTVEQHALLVAARAKISGLAREGEQVLVPAGIAVNSREALARVATGDEVLDENETEIQRQTWAHQGTTARAELLIGTNRFHVRSLSLPLKRGSLA
ncbi:MAG: hypothetical protein WD795_01815 [Woeseia sp.]